MYERPENRTPLTPEQQALVLEHLPLCRYVVNRQWDWLRHRLSHDDALQHARLALVWAAQHFDPIGAARCGKKPATFKTYAYKAIHLQLLNLAGREQRSLARGRGGTCNPTGGPYNPCPDSGPDRPAGGETAEEFVGRRDEAEQTRRRLARLLATLAPRTRRIVERYYGIGCEPESIRQIATRRRRSRQRVAQILKKARAALREAGHVGG